MPPDICITHVQIILPHRLVPQGWAFLRAGRIVALGAGEAPAFDDSLIIDGRGMMLAPGYIDIHVHGGAGYEAMDATAESLQQMARLYAAHGVTSFLPTTWTAPRGAILKAMQSIAANLGAVESGASIVGIHMEGPYLNPSRCGAQDVQQIRRADREEMAALFELDALRLVAVAPEYPENHWLIQACAKRGIAVSAAHTAATYDEMQQAIALGLTQTTHTFNAMTGLHHREPGTLGAALASEALRCEVIADGIHVHPAAMKVLYRAKGRDGVMLITDAVRGAGLPAGTHYAQDGRTVTLDGVSARLADGSLAGSVLHFDEGVRHFAAAIEAPFSDFWQATSLNAARAIGMGERTGSLEVGKDADCILLDAQLNVHLTIARGRIVYKKA